MLEKVWDWIFKILSILVVPLLIWGVSLEVRLAVQQTEIVQLQADVKEAQKIQDSLNAKIEDAPSCSSS